MGTQFVHQLAAVVVVLGAAPAMAAGDAPEQDDAPQLAEVTVTARRVAAPLHDSAVSATVLGGNWLEETATFRPEDLVLPGIKIGPAGVTDVLSIRGIASGINFGFEQSAPCFNDGVWFGSSRCSRIGYLDVERVEILKGPQPTYYGKNAIAGAFGIVTRKPQPEFSAGMDAWHEFNHDEFALGGMLNQPFGERVAARIAVRRRELDGYMSNSVDGRKDPRQRDAMGRFALRASPIETLTLDLKLEIADDRSTTTSQHVRCDPEAFANPRLINPAFEDCRMDRTRSARYEPGAFGSEALALFDDPDRPGERFHNELVSTLAAAAWRLPGGHAMTANVAYYDQRFHAWAKPDQSWNQRVLARFDDSTRLVSQELRFDSPMDRKWSWTAGAYHEDIARDNSPFTQVSLPAGRAILTNWREDSRSWSMFGEAGIGLTGTLTLHAGGRYTEARRGIVADRTVYLFSPDNRADGSDQWSYAVPASVTQQTTPPPIATAKSRRDDAFTPALSLEWRPGDGRMFYLGWREGFKAGGFSSFLTGDLAQLGFRPETVTYWEAGLKFGTDGGAWRFSAAVFDGDYRDLQVSVVDPDSPTPLGTVLTRNAGGARSRGVDLEGAWIFAPGWQADIAVYYLDATYGNFRDASCYPTPRQTIAQGCVRIGGAELPVDATVCQDNAGVNCAQDLSGFPTSYAPQWSGNLALRYGRALRAAAFGRPLKLSAAVEVMATDSYYTSVNGAPGSRQGGFTKVDARIGLGTLDKGQGWEVALIGRNLTDKLYANWYEPLVNGGTNSGWSANTARPRQIGLQMRLGF